MKNGKKCPKCGSSRIASPHWDRMFKAGTFRVINPRPYICADCGYIEEYIRTKDLEKLNNHVSSEK